MTDTNTRRQTDKIHLILADDHPLVLEGLKLLFEHLSWIDQVDLAHDGIQLCEHSCIDKADAVIVDLSMPRLDGLSSIRRLRRRYPLLAIVAITGSGHYFPEAEVRAAGADDYLSKQRSGEEVIAALENALMQHGYYLPNMNHGPMADRPVEARLLTEREREILKLLGEGYGIEETADILSISSATVRKHREHLHEKLGTSNTASLTRIAVRMGLVTD